MSRIETIITEAPLISSLSRVPNTAQLANITELINGPFTWTIAAQGGFKTASVKLRMSITAAFKFLNDYVGKRLIFTHPAAPIDGLCWEGMISTITVDDGKSPISRSIANTYNWVKVLYSTVDYSQATPVLGQQKETSPAIASTSLNTYGQRQLYYSAGGMSDTNATYLREALFNKYQDPRTLSTGATVGQTSGVGDAEVTLDAAGYWETLDKRFYIDTFTAATSPIDQVIQDVIDPFGAPYNSFLSPDSTSGLVPNALTQSRYQDKAITIQQYLNKLCGLGHSGYYGPSFFGVYENRICYYTPYPVDKKYTMRRLDPLERIFDAATGYEVLPWLVRPAQIINIPDILPNGLTYADDVTDVRSFVIGEVTFTAPNKITLVPATDDPTQVLLSRISGGTF